MRTLSSEPVSTVPTMLPEKSWILIRADKSFVELREMAIDARSICCKTQRACREEFEHIRDEQFWRSSRGLHADGSSVSGDRKLKQSTPRLAAGRPQPPPWASTIERQIDSRAPTARFRGVERLEHALKSRGAKPEPESRTSTDTPSGRCGC